MGYETNLLVIGHETKYVRAPDIVYTKKNVLEHAVFMLKLLVLRSERAKPVFKYVQKHFYDPKYVLSYIIVSNARDVTWV